LKIKAISYVIHILKRIIEQPKILLDYRYYVMKLRFHFWPLIPKNFKKKIYIFDTELNIENDTFNGRGIYSYRELKDEQERDLIQDQIEKNSVCIDIGSNVGFYSVYLLQNSIAKKVYAFEKNNNSFDLLLKNTKNLNCKQIKGEVGINKGQVLIDDVVGLREKIDFIKIDIDGLDYYALRSCEKIIDKFKPKILIEISESSVRYHNISFLDVIEYLNKKDYECYYPNKNLIKFDKTYLKKDEVRNLYFK